jgi:hypothetical protein
VISTKRPTEFLVYDTRRDALTRPSTLTCVTVLIQRVWVEGNHGRQQCSESVVVELKRFVEVDDKSRDHIGPPTRLMETMQRHLS